MITFALNFFIVLSFVLVGYMLGTARSSRRVKELLEYNNERVQEIRVLQVRIMRYKMSLNSVYSVSKSPSFIPFYDEDKIKVITQVGEELLKNMEGKKP